MDILLLQMIKAVESKVQFLLFSFLNSQKLLRGEITSSSLRERTYNQFKEFKPKEDISRIMPIHYSKFVAYCLSLSDLPELKQVEVIEDQTFPFSDVKIGAEIHDFLVNFYQNTDFEDFYTSIREEYLADVETVNNLLKQVDVDELLSIWGNAEGEMVVIPMPIINPREGFGPQVNGIAYQVIGGPYDFKRLHTILHEASHPRVKVILKDFLTEIEKYNDLIKGVDFENFPKIKSYVDNWRVFFEEHLIRAVQWIFIDTKLGFSKKEGLEYEFESGLIYIYKFAEVLEKYSKDDLDFKKVIPEILENCGRK